MSCINYRLAKDNQFFTYARYAIGEIVLVVIGILIALQVNEWNGQRKMKQMGNNALIRMHTESELIVDYIKKRLNKRKHRIKQIEISAFALQKKSLKDINEADFGMGIFSTRRFHLPEARLMNLKAQVICNSFSPTKFKKQSVIIM